MSKSVLSDYFAASGGWVSLLCKLRVPKAGPSEAGYLPHPHRLHGWYLVPQSFFLATCLP